MLNLIDPSRGKRNKWLLAIWLSDIERSDDSE
jgi:hypothetical protein